MLTSYWSVSLALADMLHERIGLPNKAAWLLATVPSLLLVWLGDWQFLESLRLAAGATAIVVALITIPMYWQARQQGPIKNPAWTLGALGTPGDAGACSACTCFDGGRFTGFGELIMAYCMFWMDLY